MRERPSRDHLARIRPSDAGDAFEELLLTLALQRRNPQHLAFRDAKGHVRKRAAIGEAADLERRRLSLRPRLRPADDGSGGFLRDLGAKHEIDDLLPRAAGLRDADRHAVPQHRRAVAKGGDLRHPVGNEDDARSLVPEGAHDREDPLGKVGGKRRRDLVEHQDLRVRGQRPRKVDEPQGCELDPARDRRKVDILDPEPGHLFPHRAERDAGEAHVLGDGKVRHNGWILIHGHDAGLARFGRRPEVNLSTGERDVSLVRGKDARDDLDERALARSVRAHKRVDFARPHLKARRAQRPHRSEGLCNAAKAKKRRGFTHALS